MLYDPHLCAITETWLHDLILDSEMVPLGYQTFIRDRGSRGGGVAVVAKRGIDVSVEEQITNHESLFLKVSLGERAFILCAIYRPPDAEDSFMQKLYDHLQTFTGKNMIITGDFNLPAVDWQHMSYDQSVSEDCLMDTMFSVNLEQIVSQWTRGNSILDVLLITEAFWDGLVQVENGISDYKLVSFCWTWVRGKKEAMKSTIIKIFPDQTTQQL